MSAQLRNVNTASFSPGPRRTFSHSMMALVSSLAFFWNTPQAGAVGRSLALRVMPHISRISYHANLHAERRDAGSATVLNIPMDTSDPAVGASIGVGANHRLFHGHSGVFLSYTFAKGLEQEMNYATPVDTHRLWYSSFYQSWEFEMTHEDESGFGAASSIGLGNFSVEPQGNYDSLRGFGLGNYTLSFELTWLFKLASGGVGPALRYQVLGFFPPVQRENWRSLDLMSLGLRGDFDILGTARK